jgi:hypothetical protein
MIVIAEPEARILGLFESVDRVTSVGCQYCMPGVSRLSIFACRGLREPLSEAWPRLKHYE